MTMNYIPDEYFPVQAIELYPLEPAAESEITDTEAGEDDDWSDWKRWGMVRFLKGYDDTDVIYDLM
jgi:hypothetical protein